MIKNIIFDIGDVLVRFEETAHAKNLFGEKKGNDVLAILWASGMGNDFDRGIESDENILEKYISMEPTLREEVLKYYNTIGDCIFKYDYAIPWINELKEKGYKVYFLSNYSEWFIKANPYVLDFIPYMDGGVFSYDVHYLKPEKEIFETICNKYDLNPCECIFIDDLSRNIEGAKLFGLNGYVFHSYEEDYEKIMKILVNDK